MISLFILGMLAFRLKDERWTASALVVWSGTLGTLALLLIPKGWILLPIAALLLLLAALHKNWFAKAMESRALVWLGEQSYSLYMIHAVVQIFTINFFAPKLGIDLATLSPIGGFLGMALCVSVSIVAADQMRRWIEVSAREAIKRWGKPAKLQVVSCCAARRRR